MSETTATKIEYRKSPHARERGSWLWGRCYACGHRLRFDSTACPQCSEEFDGRKEPKVWPEHCECPRCTDARQGVTR